MVNYCWQAVELRSWYEAGTDNVLSQGVRRGQFAAWPRPLFRGHKHRSKAIGEAILAIRLQTVDPP